MSGTATISNVCPISFHRKRKLTATDFNNEFNKSEFLGEVNSFTANLNEYLESVEEREKSNPINLALASCAKILSFTIGNFIPKECPIEKERRERSVVIEFLPESTKGLASERIDEDFNRVREILDIAEIEVRPETVFRMGQVKKPEAGKAPLPRLLKVVLPRASSQLTLLKNSKKIKDSPTFNRVRIRPSLSKSERDQQWELRQEKRKRNMDGGDFVIYAGNLMERAKVAEFKASSKPPDFKPIFSFSRPGSSKN